VIGRKSQGCRPDIGSSPNKDNLKKSEDVSLESGDSRKTPTQKLIQDSDNKVKKK